MPRSPAPTQLGLFGAVEAVGAATLAPDAEALARALPPGLRLGTSSWSFPGWRGLVYDRPADDRLLSREGLRAYARCPLLRAVGLDRTHYATMTAAQLHELADQVPDDFRFLVKAHEACTLVDTPDHPRYGARRGQENPLFFDPAWATEQVVGPAVEGLGAKLGVILFQLAPQSVARLGGPRFPERLHHFLSGLPRGVPVAFELRNPQLLTPDYAAALAAHGAVHCLSAHPSMPAPAAQARLTGALDGAQIIARWMLQRSKTYEEAKDDYAPFDRLVEPDPHTRAEWVDLLQKVASKPVILIINNKAEGSSPLSALHLARALVG
ncbi:DUF72 domain-containing protein [Myxococcota bacterium]|nr:DUF72 domain-containing protein [Myxococcota bacterium]